MKPNRNIRARAILSALYFVTGASIFIYGEFATIDSFWSGMGTALIVVGVLYTIRNIRYNTDKTYKEKFDTETKDERNRCIAMKAWSWTGYLLVFIFAIATIVLKIAGYENLMFLASGVVCLIIVIYWIAYYILRKKY